MRLLREYVSYKKYGKCLSLVCGGLKLLVTAELGPRVIFFGANGGKNLFYEDLADEISLSGEYFDKNFASGEAWHIYGGHRLWKSPEDYATYAPDNRPPRFEDIPNGVIAVSAPEKMTGLEKSVKIEFVSETEARVTHAFKNVSKNAVSAALWSITVMEKGGTLRIPLSTKDTGWLANRNLVLWSYTDINDPRLTLKNDLIELRQDPSATKSIKIGTASPLGRVEYTAATGERFVKTFTPARLEKYPDLSSNIEAYTSAVMIEAETLSELFEIAPGDTKEHIETWQYFASGQ